MKVQLRSALQGMLIVGLLLSASSAAMADSNRDLVETLVKKGILTAEEAKPLLDRIQEEAKPVDTPVPSASVGKSGIVVKSPEGDFSMQVGGRLHADFYTHSGDENLAGGVQAADGTELRRSRIYLKGTASKNFKYNIEADLASNRVSLKDVFLTYTGFNGPLELTFGSQKHSVSMEIEESSNDIMFTERSLLTAMTGSFFDRAIGVNLKAKGNNWSVKGGVYGDAISSGASNNDEGRGFGIRGTYTPIMEKDKVVHLGASFGSRSTSDDNELNGRSAALSQETSNASSLRLFNTGTIADVDSIDVGILELAAMYGPFSFQSEVAQSTLDRDFGGDADFSGFYAQLGYTLTGESRTYKGSDGEFKRLKPASPFSLQDGTWGAWELAARYDELDLNDGNISGGDGKRLTLGVNWYLNDNVRFLANYALTYDISNGPILEADGSDADDIGVFTFRTQWAF